MCLPECCLDEGSVKQAEGGVQCFAEVSVVVVVDVPGVNDNADPELAVPPIRMREVRVVAG